MFTLRYFQHERQGWRDWKDIQKNNICLFAGFSKISSLVPKKNKNTEKFFLKNKKIFFSLFFKNFVHFWKLFQRCRKENISQPKERILLCFEKFFCAIDSQKRKWNQFFCLSFSFVALYFLFKTFEACHSLFASKPSQRNNLSDLRKKGMHNTICNKRRKHEKQEKL
jgi:hypothetical protein